MAPVSSTLLLLLAFGHLSTSAAVQASNLARMLNPRAGCGNPKLADDLSGCFSYCDTKVTQIDGPSIKASDRVICDTTTCADSRANSVTVTESFTETAGFSIEPITATQSFEWAKSVSSTNTYSFTISNGDDGYIEFIPKLNKICGTLYSYSFTEGSLGDICTSTVEATDPNACGTTSAVLGDGTADGTFTFCYTSGKGCTPFKNAGGSKMVLT